MALNFPASPINGQVYTDATSGNRYVYDATNSRWNSNTYVSAVMGGFYSGNYGEIGRPESLGDIFRVHTNTLTQNVTIYSANNAIAAGPLYITGAETKLTIQTGARVVIV